jgi:hypothetical protein
MPMIGDSKDWVMFETGYSLSGKIMSVDELINTPLVFKTTL